MTKQYKFMRVKPETVKNFKIKTEKMNKELAKIGVKGKVHQIDIANYMSKKPFILDTKELVGLAKGKK